MKILDGNYAERKFVCIKLWISTGETNMDKAHYKEMKKNLQALLEKGMIQDKDIYVFGHCNASEELIDLLEESGCNVKAILDNNVCKHGFVYKKVPIVSPKEIMKADCSKTIVCIVAKAYAAMEKQLRCMGYIGNVQKLAEYNSYAEYSLSPETIHKKVERVKRGIELLEQQKEQYPGYYRIYCPFSALGDMYYMMSYLPYFLEKREIRNYVVFTIGHCCKEVVTMFGGELTEIFSQKDMDESIQAVLYTNDREAFIPHHDRPYVTKLAQALYKKKISLEMIYKSGIFGLREDCIPYKPIKLGRYELLEQITPGKAVILSPYAKSIANISKIYWKQIVSYYKKKGYQVFTNTAGEEKPLEGTIRLEVRLSELSSIVERAGTFVGIRSGLCDVIREANCKKVVLYPDCYYSDTKWKVEEIFHLDNYENIVVHEK